MFADSRCPPLRGRRPPRQRLIEALGFLRRRYRWWAPHALGGKQRPRPVVVLTTSRSGSTWLCELLARGAWAGAIPEHWRPEHTAFVQTGGDQNTLTALFTEIAKELASGYCGGSKFIWDDFPDIPPLADAQRCHELFEPLSALNPVFVRLRRDDPVAQAISRHRSAKSGLYHAWRTQKQHPREADVDYDFAQIRHHLDILQRAERSIDVFWQQLAADCFTVSYETLRQQPVNLLLPILQRVTGAPDAVLQTRLEKVGATSALQPLVQSTAKEWHRRFQQDMAS